jgi:hypothetical protein
MDGLNIDNILSVDEIDNLFVEEEETESPDVDLGEEEKQKEKTTEVDPENLFSDEPESVGSEEEDNQEDQEDTDSKKDGSSPKKNFYSSIAKALQEEGIFPDLDDERTNKISTPEDFAQAIEETIQSKLDERQRRIDEALNANVEINDIKKYENTIQYLDSLQDETLTVEGEQGENLRKQLIFQDFVNRGYSEQRAQREVQKSLNAGTDIEDAKEALKSNKEFFNTQYETLIENAKKEDEKIIA